MGRRKSSPISDMCANPNCFVPLSEHTTRQRRRCEGRVIDLTAPPAPPSTPKSEREPKSEPPPVVHAEAAEPSAVPQRQPPRFEVFPRGLRPDARTIEVSDEIRDNVRQARRLRRSAHPVPPELLDAERAYMAAWRRAQPPERLQDSSRRNRERQKAKGAKKNVKKTHAAHPHDAKRSRCGHVNDADPAIFVTEPTCGSCVRGLERDRQPTPLSGRDRDLAWQAATRELRERHRDEFDGLFAEECETRRNVTD